MAETRAEKLERLIKIAMPNLPEGRAKSPYEISETKQGKLRLTVSNEDTGERMGFVGTDLDDVLNQFEARVAPKE